ncbi:MAG: hypothetical protein JWO55_94 [Candidatus Saccharibacteria bacterium]|jgi:hypothetical protein|nr:hypothetical protein [Candidatus Saccharibacteria bacterium]
MENKTTTTTDRFPPLYTPTTIGPPSNESISTLEQGNYDRWEFEQLIASHSLSNDLLRRATSENYSHDSVSALMTSFLLAKNKNHRKYKWLTDTDPQIIARLINEIDEFRSTYATEHAKLPKDSRIYREYRLKLEQNTDDQYLKDAVHILGALMEDDFTHGKLPL